MLTYQDFKKCRDINEISDFILHVIEDHESSPEFITGQTAGEFYRHHDPYIEKMQKKIYDLDGNEHKDIFTPNHKITANWFYIFTQQMVSYQLGNGVSFENPEIKKKLGNKFDYSLQTILTYAACDGEAYGLATENNGIIPLCFACDNKKPHFAPLKDENDGKIKAGVNYWRLDPDSPLIADLYTLDGYIRFKKYTNENNQSKMVIIKELTPYNLKIVSNEIQGNYIQEGKNYSELPIVPLTFINAQSSLIGNVETLVTYDLTLSGLVNDVAKNLIYWVLSNCDGMDEEDDARFLLNLFRTNVLHLDENVNAQPHQMQIQYEANEAALTRLEQQLINDFMAVDTKSLRSGAITTVEINQAYENLNLKCDEVEKCLGEFIQGILKVYGFDENEPFHFTRAKNVNQTEAIQNAIATAPFMGDEATTKEICEIKGKIDDFETIQKQKISDDLNLFNNEESENTITKIAELIFQKLKDFFNFCKKNDIKNQE